MSLQQNRDITSPISTPTATIATIAALSIQGMFVFVVGLRTFYDPSLLFKEHIL